VSSRSKASIAKVKTPKIGGPAGHGAAANCDA
jgi:hypothetical protein